MFSQNITAYKILGEALTISLFNTDFETQNKMDIM